MNDNIFRIIALAVFLAGASISIYYRSKAERESGEKITLEDEGRWMAVSLRIAGMAVWLGVFAFLINPAWMNWSRVDLPEWLRWAGVLMGVAGDALAYWVFSHLRNNVTPTVVTRADATLVTSGPYRWVRHPLYLMGLVGYTGFALLAENWFIGLAAVAAFFLLTVRTKKEETRLVAKFGDDYRAYMQRTGRFFPKLS